MLEYLKRHVIRISFGLALLLVFLFHASGTFQWDFIDRMENIAYDARVVLTMPRGQNDQVVIVDIDEKSLGEQGRWPWSRDRLSTFLDQLFDKYAVRVVGFDIVFAEPDESSGLSRLEQLIEVEFEDSLLLAERLEKLKPQLDYDQRFADSMADRAVILGYYFNKPTAEQDIVTSGQLPAPVMARDSITDKNVSFAVAKGFGSNLGVFQSAAISGGHFNPEVDSDGIVRRVPILFEYEEGLYESLAAALARFVVGGPEYVPGYEYALGDAESRRNPKLEWLNFGEQSIPVDENGNALVPYIGRQGSFDYVSASDVIEGRIEPVRLLNKIVLVGTTAPGLLDLRSTPVASEYAGVEIHANLVAGILNGTIKKKPGYVVGVEFVLLVLVGLVMAILLPALTPMMATVVTVILLIVSIALNLLVWVQVDLVLPIASGIIMILVMFLLNMSYGYFVETRGKRELAGMFGQYVPTELVDEMSLDPKSYSFDSESRDMTVLFSDVRDFTSISELLEPQELSELMGEFLTPMTKTIFDNRGTIDKYMGDAIMAFWGAPLEDLDHPEHAVIAALELRDNLAPMNEIFVKRGWPALRIGVGVHTGTMSVGNMGSEYRRAYTVMGDPVNLGSRLEGLTKIYGVIIIVSDETRRRVPILAYRELDKVRVKGKKEPVGIFEPLGLKDSISKADKDELKLYREALKLYRAENWDMAEIQFVNLKNQHPDRKLYDLYINRIVVFREHPPETGWDGVFTHTSK